MGNKLHEANSAVDQANKLRDEIKEILVKSQNEDKSAEEALKLYQSLKESGVFEKRQQYAEKSLEFHTEAKTAVNDIMDELSKFEEELDKKLEMMDKLKDEYDLQGPAPNLDNLEPEVRELLIQGTEAPPITSVVRHLADQDDEDRE